MSESWHETLRRRGYRVTPQRELVLEAIKELGHATPEDICGRIQRTVGGVNLSTVYRSLEVLERVDLVSHAHLHHGSPTYHLAAEADHVHLVCQHCGAVTEVAPVAAGAMIDTLDDELGFQTDVRHLTVFGRCRDCRAAQGRVGDRP